MENTTETPDDDTVTVKFTVDFPPYKIKAGNTKRVKRAIAKKLLKEYGVIEPYEKPTDPIVVVRVINNLSHKFPKWFPSTEQIAQLSYVEEDIKAGNVVLVDTPENTVLSQNGKVDKKQEDRWISRLGLKFDPDLVINSYKHGATKETKERIINVIALRVQDHDLATRIFEYGMERHMLDDVLMD